MGCRRNNIGKFIEKAFPKIKDANKMAKRILENN